MAGLQDEWRAGWMAAGKYRIISQLGQGGTAEVHLAVAKGPAGFRKLVVLKVLRRDLENDPAFRAMFLGEARLAARLSHPNIVQTNEVMELADGTPVIVMEYLDGRALSQILAKGRSAGFSPSMQVRVLVDALQGLHAAHELTDFGGTPLGLVHRDVSPQNIFVTLDGQAKVLDFGIAKVAHQRLTADTDIGMIKGKLRYMPAEQLAGDGLTRRADIYSAGVILWESLVGERMWKGHAEAEIKARVLSGDLPFHQLERASVPPAAVRICRRALALRPEDRHGTALALADELEAVLPAFGPQPSHRDIGAMVAHLFESDRLAMKRLIEGQSELDDTCATPPARAPLGLSLSGKAKLPHQARRRARRAAILAALMVPAVVAAGFTWSTRKAPAQAPRMLPTAAVPPDRPPIIPVAPPESIPVSVTKEDMPATPTKQGKRSHPTRGSRRPTPKGNAAAPAANDCDPPFYLDYHDGYPFKRTLSRCK